MGVFRTRQHGETNKKLFNILQLINWLNYYCSRQWDEGVNTLDVMAGVKNDAVKSENNPLTEELVKLIEKWTALTDTPLAYDMLNRSAYRDITKSHDNDDANIPLFEQMVTDLQSKQTTAKEITELCNKIAENIGKNDSLKSYYEETKLSLLSEYFSTIIPQHANQIAHVAGTLQADMRGLRKNKLHKLLKAVYEQKRNAGEKAVTLSEYFEKQGNILSPGDKGSDKPVTINR